MKAQSYTYPDKRCRVFTDPKTGKRQVARTHYAHNQLRKTFSTDAFDRAVQSQHNDEHQLKFINPRSVRSQLLTALRHERSN